METTLPITLHSHFDTSNLDIDLCYPTDVPSCICNFITDEINYVCLPRKHICHWP